MRNRPYAAATGDFPGKQISNERALNELDWKATTSFHDGVHRYVEWVRGNALRSEPAAGREATLNGNGHPSGGSVVGDGEHPPRVLVLTADIGEGHDLPARMIKAEVEQEFPDAEVEIVDGLQAMGRICSSAVRDGSQVHLSVDAVALRHPVLADHPLRADPLAGPPGSATRSAAGACCG